MAAPRIPRRAVAATMTATLALATSAIAQDEFPDSVPATSPPRSAPRPTPAPAPPPSTTAASSSQSPNVVASGAETDDFGVAPTSQLRPTEQLHGPTPTAIPGARVVGTTQLAKWLQQAPDARGVLLLHAVADRTHLPRAVPALPAAQGGRFDDDVQRGYGEFLERATAGDRSRLLVTYCQGTRCWGSYNAALRAVRLGYTNVHWYRGGLEAWQRAGLPVQQAER